MLLSVPAVCDGRNDEVRVYGDLKPKSKNPMMNLMHGCAMGAMRSSMHECAMGLFMMSSMRAVQLSCCCQCLQRAMGSMISSMHAIQ